MCKAFLILVLLVFSVCNSQNVAAQKTVSKNQPPTNLNNPKSPLVTAPLVVTASPERKAEAKRLYDEGMKLVDEEQFPQAAEHFQQAVKLDTEYADAYAALGRTYFKLREWQKAIDNLRRAAELNTQQRDAQDAIHKNLLEQKRSEPSAATSNSAKIQNTPNTGNTTLPTPNLTPAAKQPVQQANNSKKVESKQDLRNTNNLGNGLSVAPPSTQTSKQPESVPQSNRANTKAESTRAPLNNNAVNSSTLNPSASAQPTKAPASVAQANNANKTVESTRAPLNSNTGNNATLNPSSSTQPAKPPASVAQANNANKTVESTRAPLSSNTGNSATLNPSPSTQPAKPPASVAQANNANNKLEAKANNNPNVSLKTTTQAPQPQSQPAQLPEANKQVGNLKANLPDTSDVSAKALIPESKSAEKIAQNATAPEQMRESIQDTAGSPVSMNVTPSSEPLASKSVSPVSPKPLEGDLSLTRIYRVGANDVLDVRLNDSQGNGSTLFTVTPAGMLEHPMLTEPLPVAGFTVDEISTKIEEDLKKRAVIENPKAIVGVRDYGSHTILVSGLVKDSGTKFLRREAIPLYVVVADAQPLPEAARVSLVRNELNQIYEIDLTQAAEMNLLVRQGDVITLQPNVTQFIYIGGEVKAPGEKTFRRGLTLTQAILTAGGAGEKAKAASIGRDDSRGFVVETRVSLKEIASGKTADPILKPGDRIVILR
jgi:protein involved in polysaccharide export with SLBB domain/Tfp pilus assembly protein PilF